MESYELTGLSHPVCPYCGSEAIDVHNGGDPRAWWNDSNIPDGHLKCQCEEVSCKKWYYINSSWSPSFDITTKEHYEAFEGDSDDFEAMDEA
jgi:hypothetical protein